MSWSVYTSIVWLLIWSWAWTSNRAWRTFISSIWWLRNIRPAVCYHLVEKVDSNHAQKLTVHTLDRRGCWNIYIHILKFKNKYIDLDSKTHFRIISTTQFVWKGWPQIVTRIPPRIWSWRFSKQIMHLNLFIIIRFYMCVVYFSV